MSKRKRYFKDNKEMVDYLNKILNEDSDSDNIDIEEDMQFPECDEDLSDENLEEENHSSDSEINASDHEITENNSDGNFYMGKDKVTKWKKEEIVKTSKTKSKNIIKKMPGPTAYSNGTASEIDTFLKLIDLNMIDEIIDCTNKYIERIEDKYNQKRDCKQTSRSEFMALMGLLYFIGTMKSQHANVQQLWAADGTGIQILRAAMSYKRFLFLLRCIRFDDIDTRSERRKSDKLAAIRSIWDSFVQNCLKSYNTSEFITIDEMLHPFRGRCSWIQYMPSKPAKYGIKIFALCDAKTFYCSNMEIYVGKQPPGLFNVENRPFDIVKRLVTPIENSNKNLTTDNWFTSFPLVDYLLEKKITFIGTVKKNKREIPLEFLPGRHRVVGTSTFGFQKNKTLVSYVPKKNKAVVLVSSLHDKAEIDAESGKPELILDYNMTKGGVDVCDKMCASYSVSRITRRWPLVIFYTMMNITGINSRVLFLLNNVDEEPGRRITFLRTLSKSLMKEHLISRAQIPSLPRDVSAFLDIYYSTENLEKETSNRFMSSQKRGSCYMCGRKKNSSSTMKCNKCVKFICKQHSKKQIICLPCEANNVDEIYD